MRMSPHNYDQRISIHAPTKGATNNQHKRQHSGSISIHAPTKGATIIEGLREGGFIDFNPRSHEGSDYYGYDYPGNSRGFQSTLPRRERLRRNRQEPQRENFNPRSHEGSDVGRGRVCLFAFKFQSTLPRRERPSGRLHRGRCNHISIHAPTKGATAILHKIMNLYCGTLTNNTQINSLIININYINRIKTGILNYFLVRITL